MLRGLTKGAPMSWLDTLEQIRTRDFRKAPEKDREQAARDVINICSYSVAVVSVSPIPFSDAVLMLPIQSDSAAAKDLALELGAVAGVGFLARQGIKALLPVLGALLTVPAAFAASWGMGRVAMEYFKNPGASKETLRGVYEAAKKEGTSKFSRAELEKFRAQDGAAKPKGKAKTRAKTRAKPRAKKAAPWTPARIIEKEIPKRLAAKPEVVERIAGIVHVEISGPNGGRWTLDLTRTEGWVSKGLNGQPKVTVRCADEDFVQIATGTRDAQMAVLSGSLVFEPMDLELAGEIGKLFA
jgi:uncharacterized protein (DUF697 family)/putative sterol carrier protein